MKKNFFVFLSLMLSFCFILSGCNLFIEDQTKVSNQIAVEAGDVFLTREELVRGYNNYYQTFYYNNGQNSEKAMDELIDYLISRKLIIKDAERLVENEEIEISETEYNYIWYSVYTALINNIETFEKEIKKELNIEEDKEEELEKEEDFIYTPYEKTAKIIKNEETGKYEIVIINYVLEEKIDEESGERVYNYVPEEELVYFDGEKLDVDKIIEMVNIEKLFKGSEELSSEEEVDKSISKEALRRYIEQLKNNEKGKDLSIDNESVYIREIERIYKVVYENLLVNKIYDYKTSTINISEEDLLNRYLIKVKENYEKYLLDENKFTSLIKDSSKLKEPYYIPEIEENFFYITHLLIKLSETQVYEINKIKIDYETGKITKEEYDIEYDKIVDKSKVKLSERDMEGNIIKKDTDEDAITLEEMLQNLEDDMAEIDDKYGLTIEYDFSKISKELYFQYIHERADKFNEYMYKYGQDPGSAQGKNENWFIYTMGDKDTDLGFVEKFVEKARDLFNDGKGIPSTYGEIVIESWVKDKEDGVETLVEGSTGYSIMFYGGQVENPFDCFKEQKFNLEDLLNNEYDPLFILDNQRLSLNMNKTLFDLLYEDVYEKIYDDITKEYKDLIIKDSNIIKYKNIYKDLIAK